MTTFMSSTVSLIEAAPMLRALPENGPSPVRTRPLSETTTPCISRRASCGGMGIPTYSVFTTNRSVTMDGATVSSSPLSALACSSACTGRSPGMPNPITNAVVMARLRNMDSSCRGGPCASAQVVAP